MKTFTTLTLAAALIFSGSASAQTLDASQRKSVVDNAASAMRTAYVFPEVGEKAAVSLEKALAAGAYDSIADSGALADRLTADLRAVAPDGHLRVRAAGAAPAAGAGGPPPGPPPQAENGIVRADALPGGVGYLEVVAFPGPAAFKPSLDKAMTALAGSKAIIVDIRRNGGGSPDGVAYLTSFFMDPAKKTLINEFHSRTPGAATVTVRPSYNSPTPVSFLGKPVYILTSKRTFSGGEEFAYNMQSFKLATLVGETTGGGANGGGTRSLSPQISMFVPNFYPINPVTKANWEGVGVIPEIKTEPADALKVALQRLGQSPATGEVTALSTARLFEPRTTRNPASEAALRRMVTELIAGEPNYALMVPEFAEVTRAQLPVLKQRFAALGPLEIVRFMSVVQGMDSYELKFAQGVLEYQLAVNGAGLVTGARFRPLPVMSPTDDERMAAFRENDKNADGKLEKVEYLGVLQKLGFANQIDSLFAQRDVNRDSFISPDEYRNVIPQ